MTDQTAIAEPIVSAPPATYRERQIAYWRDLARENWLLGFMDLARRCERFASDWEWEPVP